MIPLQSLLKYPNTSNAVNAPEPPNGPVASISNRLRWKPVIPSFKFLQACDVGAATGEPGEKQIQALIDAMILNVASFTFQQQRDPTARKFHWDHRPQHP
jgi:hypothetical protein